MNKLRPSRLNTSELQLDFKTIDLLRFPMALAVVILHLTPDVVAVPNTNFPLISQMGLYNVVVMCLSHVISFVAVPLFFIVSGYLFFINMQKFLFTEYKRKLHKRLNTLLVPYLIWNILPLLSSVVVLIISLIKHGDLSCIGNVWRLLNPYRIFWHASTWGLSNVNFFGMPLPATGPLDYPLWFVRDLIVLIVLAPIIYIVVRKTGKIGLGIMFLCMYFSIWFYIPGLRIKSIFFFSLGAYFGIRGISIVRTLNPYKYLICGIAIVLMLVATYYNGVRWVSPFWILFGAFAFYLMAAHGIEHWNWRYNKFLVSSCFFVYALHGNNVLPLYGSPLDLFRNVNIQIFGNDTPMEKFAVYFLTFLETVAFCLLLFAILKKVFPRKIKLLTGGR